MRSLYLILAATAAIATCAPQPKNNDIIWYPVDNEEGVFISIYGEKHKTSQNPKWRSHRRARYSGAGPSWPFDPTENQDPSFFHNINQRRPLLAIPSIPNVPHSFQNQEFNRPRGSPQGQPNQNDNLQDIFNEVFGKNKYVSANEYPGLNNQWSNSQPVNNNQWSNAQPVNNQWGNSQPVNNNQWGNSQPINNQWGGNPVNQWNRPQQLGTTSRLPWQQPVTSNQWSSTTSRPTESEWITQSNRPASSVSPNRPTNQSDKLIFPEDNTESTTAPGTLVPMDPTTMSPCERLCPVTPEYNPVCGSDGMSYSNAGRLKCAQACGKDVKISHHGNCGRTPFITPLVSKNPRRRKEQVKFSQFW